MSERRPPPQPPRGAPPSTRGAREPEPPEEKTAFDASALDEPEERTQIADFAGGLPARPGAAAQPPPRSGAPAAPKGVLTVLMGPDEGRRYLLGDGTSHVGRSLECEVVLNDPSASRRHFRIEGADGRFSLIDLGSENGTCVGGTRVKQALLEQDDQISVGTTLLHFGYVGAPAPNLGAEAPRPRAKTAPVAAPKSGSRKVVVGILGVVGLGAAIAFTGHALHWWQLFGSAPAAPAVAQSDTPNEPPDPPDDPGTAVDEPPQVNNDAPDAGPTLVAAGAGLDVEPPVAAVADDVAPADDVVPTGNDDTGAGEAGNDEVAEAPADDAGVAEDVGEPAEGDVPDAAEDAGVLGAADDTGAPPVEDAGGAADDTGAPAVEDAGAPSVEDAGAPSAVDDAGPAVAAAEDVGEAATPDAGPTADGDTVEAGGTPGDQLVLEARLLVGEKKLAEAQAKLMQAAKAGAPPESVQVLIKTIASASGHRLIFESQTKALAAKNYPTVIALAGQIPPESPYAAEAADLAAQARDAIAGVPGSPEPKAPELNPEAALFESVKTLAGQFLGHVLAKRDAEAVKLLLAEADCSKAVVATQDDCKREVLAMTTGLEALRKELKGTRLGEVSDPEKLEGSEEWGALRQFVVEASVLGAGEPTEATVTVVELAPGVLRVAFPVAAPAEAVEAPQQPTAPVGAAPSLDRAKGLRTYAAGDFSGAAAYFTRASKDASLSDDERTRARQLARSIQLFEKHYAAGTSAAQQLRDVAAITALSEALIDDRRISGSYQGKIKKVLANMYAHRASTQFQAGRLWEASKAARKALGLDKGHAGAKLIADKLSAAVDTLLQKAKAAKGAGNSAEARRLLRDAKLIVSPGDSRAGRIQSELDAIAP